MSAGDFAEREDAVHMYPQPATGKQVGDTAHPLAAGMHQDVPVIPDAVRYGRFIGLRLPIRRQQHDHAVGTKHVQRPDEILAADRIEHEIDLLRPLLEPLRVKVDHLVGTEIPHETGIPASRRRDHVTA